MLCVVIGIVPPLDDSTRSKLFRNVTSHENPDGGDTRISWARDTVQESWIVPDEDADNIPTMLVSSFLSDHNESSGKKGVSSVYGNNNGLRLTPEEFASFVQDFLNSEKHDDTDSKDEEYHCEVWASAPAPLPLMTYGKDNSVITEDFLQSDFRQKGLCLLPNVLVSKEVDSDALAMMEKIRSMVDEAIHEAEDAISKNHPTIKVGEDAFLFREIASRSKQRFDLLINKKAGLYQIVRDQVLGPQSQVPSILQKLFSGNENNTEEDSVNSQVEWEMDLSVVYSKPGANHQGWHADGGHTEGESDAGWDDNNSTANTLPTPYAICLFVPLIDLNHTVGFTQFWPGSHKHRELVGFGPFAEVARATWDGTVRAGEAIVYDYRLLHRGMPNYSNGGGTASSTDERKIQSHPYRAVLQLLCRKTWYKERNNYGSNSIYEAEAS